jgi:hypothetical protein
MMGNREPSHPPSDPHVFGRSAGDLLVGSRSDDRSLRVRIGVALLAGLVLMAIGLYLWRRPHAPPDASAEEAASSSALAAEPPPPAPQPDAGASPVALTDARVLGCHDRGPKVTTPEQCDHLVPIEKALATAIEQAAACVPQSPGAGADGGAAATAAGVVGGATIEYVADVSFVHHRLSVSLPHAGRSVRDRKVVRACAAAVRAAMQLTALDGVEHQHAQYRFAVTATYRGAQAANANGG